ncbi:MAG: YdeI/OmpD-associated family protein [Planctomycetes bacterium]|nr:YdeI/OmpD-associated family protein [Planctomycetota bacterium]
MPTIHPQAKREMDKYIAEAPEFARPICRKLRSIIRKADAGLVEDWKWGPNFNKDGMVCGFGAFKAHVTLTFFRGSAMKDPKKLLAPCSADNAHNRSMKFVSVDEIDEKTLGSYVKEAAALNVQGVKAPARKAALATPDDLTRALAEKAKARAFFDGLPPGARRDYVEWVLQAKRPESRASRIETTVQQCGEGKRRNWKYESC